jgi:hypothetical protein
MTRWQRFREGWTRQDVFTAVIAVATVAIFWTGCNQWRTMSRELLDSENLSRAFVYEIGFAGNAITDSHTNQLTKMQFFAQWRNSGTTPTKRGYGWVNKYVSANPIPTDFAYPNYTSDGNLISHPCKRLFVPPQSVVLNVPEEIDAATLLAVQAHRQHLYFYGWVAYDDVLAHSKRHITRFCYEMTDIEISGTPVNRIDFLLGPCADDKQTCIDEECEKGDEPECAE